MSDPLVGRTIGDVEITARLGAGGMGAVYVGRDTASEDPDRVALKLLSITSHDHIRDRFVREAQIGESLRHPLLVGVRRFGTCGDYQYMVMDLVEGEDLHHVLERHRRRLPWGTVAALGRDVALALAALHERHVIHRDLKPANILLDGRGGLRLADFGLARWKRAPSHLPTEVPLTATGDAFGTPVYMAPEQFEDAKTVSTAADVYALGVVLYEALSGLLPFPADTAVELARMHMDDQPPPIRAELAPAELRQLIDALLAKDPAQRPSAATVAQRCQALTRELADAPLELTPPPGSTFTRWDPSRERPATSDLPAGSTLPPPARRRSWGLLLLAAVLLVTLPAAGALAWRRPGVRRFFATTSEQKAFQAIEDALDELPQDGPDPLVTAMDAYLVDHAEEGLLADAVKTLRRQPHRLRTALYFVPADRAQLVEVQRGSYHVGAEDPAPGEPPLAARQALQLDAFLIDRDEVSRGRYLRFHAAWIRAGRVHRCGRKDLDHAPPQSPLSAELDAPVVGVNYYDALEYARFYGRRLPSAQEWMVAASWDPQDGQPQPYPWGRQAPTEITPFPANLAFASYGSADPDTGEFTPLCAPAGTFEFDRSGFGLRDVAGNASEWCSGSEAPPAPQPLHGGSLDSETARQALLHAQRLAPPDQPPRSAGFRTALSWGQRNLSEGAR